MKLLITRPREDGLPLAQKLTDMGHVPILEPLFDIRIMVQRLPSLAAVSGLIFTSANGVRAFLAVSDRRDLPAYAVGDRTAQALSDAGFTAVWSANGDSAALAALVRQHRRPEQGALLHVAGTKVAGDLAQTLRADGYDVDRNALYEATAVEKLSAETCRALQRGELEGVLLFSPRTAALFQELIAKADLASAAMRLYAFCLSRAVAETLEPSNYRKILVAREPTQDALLHLVETSF